MIEKYKYLKVEERKYIRTFEMFEISKIPTPKHSKFHVPIQKEFKHFHKFYQSVKLDATKSIRNWNYYRIPVLYRWYQYRASVRSLALKFRNSSRFIEHIVRLVEIRNCSTFERRGKKEQPVLETKTAGLAESDVNVFRFRTRPHIIRRYVIAMEWNYRANAFNVQPATKIRERCSVINEKHP